MRASAHRIVVGGLAVIVPILVGTVAVAGPSNIAVLKWKHEVPGGVHVLDSWGDGHATGDLDGDGVPDVVLGTNDARVVAISGRTGGRLWTERLSTPSLPARDAAADVVDVDGDGVPEIVATAVAERAIVRLLDRFGRARWTTWADYREVTDLAYADLDGNGVDDIGVAAGTYRSGGGQLLVLDTRDGSRVRSYHLGAGQPRGMAARDVNGDGIADVAVEDYAMRLSVVDLAHERLLWSMDMEDPGRDVIIADVNGYGPPEVVSGGGGVVCYTRDGRRDWASPRAGDDISLADVISEEFHFRYEAEVVYTDAAAQMLFVIDGTTGETIWSRFGTYAHAIGDVDGDRLSDIVAGSFNPTDDLWPFFWFVEAIDGNNNRLWLYPLASVDVERFGLATANLDADPALEVIVANGFHVLALDVRQAPHKPLGIRPEELPPHEGPGSGAGPE